MSPNHPGVPSPGAPESTGVLSRYVQSGGYGLPADEARRLVEEVLQQPRFSAQQSETIFDRIGRALTSYLQRAIGWVNENILGVGQDSTVGRFAFWTAVVVALGLLTGFLALRLARRRAALESHHAVSVTHPTGVHTPAEFELRAGEAVNEQRFGDAIRFLYQAGLLRLADRGVIEYRSSLTSGEVAAAIRSSSFDYLALQFDRVAYGHADATREDVRIAESEWKTLVRSGDPS